VSSITRGIYSAADLRLSHLITGREKKTRSIIYNYNNRPLDARRRTRGTENHHLTISNISSNKNQPKNKGNHGRKSSEQWTRFARRVVNIGNNRFKIRHNYV